MSITSEIAALREWLREDDTRLRGPRSGSQEHISGEVALDLNQFNQFGNKDWGNGPGGWPFQQWNQFGNS